MQDRLTYANGNTITTEGFRCTVGEAIYDDEVVANENGEAFLSTYGIVGFNMNSQYLVTLEVNGVSKLYRELWTSGDHDYNNTVPMGEYTFTMDETVITGLTEGDHVRIKIEPVTVKTTDAFRAAVAKVAPKAAASDGGTGGGVLMVNRQEEVDGENTTVTLDKTAGEILDAYPLVFMNVGGADILAGGEGTPTESGGVYYFPWYDGNSHPLTASSLNAYPTVTISSK